MLLSIIREYLEIYDEECKKKYLELLLEVMTCSMRIPAAGYKTEPFGFEISTDLDLGTPVYSCMF